MWAGQLASDIRLRPSRGTHLVLRGETLPGLGAAFTVPVPGSVSRWIFALPQSDGTIFVGLTDEAVEGEMPDVPEPADAEIDFLLNVVSASLERPLDRGDVVGAFAGLRPLLDAEGNTADLSRKHAVRTSANGVVTVVGGKLTTYRRMAQDAVDATGITSRPSPTADLPLLGAAPAGELARIDAPARLVRRFGTEAPSVLANARAVSGLPDQELLSPGPRGVTLAELIFGVSHEGAVSADDLLDRRTRLGLVPADRDNALALANRALRIAGR